MGLAALCVRRPVFTTMLILALVVLGVISFRELGVDLFPKIDFATITVTTTLPGASAEEIESDVTRPIEEAVNTIQGIDELRSVSLEGLSIVIVTFVLERETEEAAQDVRERVGRVLNQLPQGVNPPLIEKVDPDASPILSITVSGQRTLRELTEVADKQIKRQLEGLAGVGQVLMVGGRERAIQIEVDADRLNALRLSAQQVVAALRLQNQEVPAGRLEQGERELTLRTLGRVSSPEQFAELVVATRQGVPIRIRDFARVEDSSEEPRSLARLDGNPAVVLEIRKQSGTNTVQIATLVRQRLERIRQALPPDIHVDIIRDQSLFIQDSISAIYEHLILGGVFASFVVLLFMNSWRAGLIAALAIPTSIISTFLFIRWAGYTVNTMTLLGLTVAVGIVIDDAIVVLENIFRYIEEKKYKPMEAAVAATREIGLAVMATTLSLVVIFLPVIFLGGIVGRWLQSFGLTAACAIVISLFVSFTLTPMLSSRYLKVDEEQGQQSRRTSKQMGLYRWVESRYMRMLEWSLAHRLAIVVICLATFLTIIPMGIWIGKDFITFDDQSEFLVRIKTPEGTSLEGTDAVLRRAEQLLKPLPHVQHVMGLINSGNQGSVTDGMVYVRLTPLEQRDVSQFELMDRARAALLEIAGVRLSVENVGIISNAAFRNVPINLALRGPDLDRLAEISGEILSKMRALPNLQDVDSSLNVGNPEVHIEIERDKAADLGVSVADIADTMRLMVSGTVDITKYKEGGELYEVRLRGRPEQRFNAASLGSLMVPAAHGELARLDNVARIEPSTGPVQIDRFNRQRQVMLTANLQTGAPLGQALADLQKIVSDTALPLGYDYFFLGFGEIYQEVISSFALAFLLAFIFMYMVLAAQFESFVHPITILASLPLAVPFALLSLFLTGKPMTLFGAIGIMLLFGIVKKNSILQIDFTNRLRREHGYERQAAILEANRTRLRPILMTTFTIVVAMIPMAFGGGSGAGSRAPIAVVIAGGQTLCFLLTLLAIPVVYSLLDDVGEWPLRERARSLRLALARSLSGLFG
ncbi:MAG: efflux RND transporter permease subunit [Acidobacteria bacterium]|nr:efflux RND transporter permease subunit [Acidobacteriota bacterium]